uniref:RlpA-like protein double-psi beta-barrel domain-containing protein n=1 Tax=Meloidogyne floridensis TaxID=298350 RepID=A0A915P9K0_9BILA
MIYSFFILLSIFGYTIEETKVVSPAFTNAQTCLKEENTNGPIYAQLNKEIQNGHFTMYGRAEKQGRGACGFDMNTPDMSAAVSQSLFNTSAKWPESCLPDKRTVRNDPVCMSKCVQVTYKGNTLTVPINNMCGGCAIDHVDFTDQAFLFLESGGYTVGDAKGATIKYVRC